MHIEAQLWVSGHAKTRAEVRLGSISTELGYQGHVRFAPGCDRIADITERQFLAKNQKWERAL